MDAAAFLFAQPAEPPPEQDYRCNVCSEAFRGPQALGWDYRCPHCESPPPFAVMLKLAPARSTASASAAITTDQVLDAQRLTVLGVLLTVGLSAGFGVGTTVGGWMGASAGVLAGLGLPLLLALAFRRRRTRRWIAFAADWATDRPNLRT